RPNPLGNAVEGPLLRPEFASFVGLHPLPIRHGCSIGELALLFHRAFGVGEEPAVVSGGQAVRRSGIQDAEPEHLNTQDPCSAVVPPERPNARTPDRLTALLWVP